MPTVPHSVQDLPEKIRSLAMDCMRVIRSDPSSYRAVAEDWFNTLPPPPITQEHNCPPDPESDCKLVTAYCDLPSKEPFYVWDHSLKHQKAFGPTYRMLNDARFTATIRFDKRHSDKYHDFWMRDARRIILVAAMAFVRDFSGAEVGVRLRGDASAQGLPWDCPSTPSYKWDGRYYANNVWSDETMGPRVLKHIEKSLSYLEKIAVQRTSDGDDTSLTGQRGRSNVNSPTATNPDSQPDETGYVRSPSDPTAYKSASDIIADQSGILGVKLTYKLLTGILEDFTKNQVRWTRPIAKTTGCLDQHRRNVHLNDWDKYIGHFNGKGMKKNDWPPQTPDQIKTRKADLQAEKYPEQRR